MKIVSACIICMLAFVSLDGAEIVIQNITKNIKASNLLYDSVNVYPGDRTLLKLENLKNPNATTYLWYIEGSDVVETETATLEWTVPSTPGCKKIIAISIDEKSKIEGSTLKLFVGSFEAPVISIDDGAKRPGCPLLLNAKVIPYHAALIAGEAICEYLWKVEKEGKLLGEYTTSTNQLELTLPLEPGFIELKVSATDTHYTHSPETLYPIEIKPW